MVKVSSEDGHGDGNVREACWSVPASQCHLADMEEDASSRQDSSLQCRLIMEGKSSLMVVGT